MPDDSDDPEVRDDVLAEGEAALFFLEALALKLIDKGVLDADEVVEALELAVSTKRTAAEEGKSPRLSNCAAAELSEVMNSISALEKFAPRVKS